MTGRTVVVLNPKSKNGATGRRWRAIEPRARAALGPIDVEATRGPRDAERIAGEAARAGVRRIVVAGGDGTTGEVVTGLLEAGAGSACEIALLPLGTGGDLARGLGVPRDVGEALARIAAGKTRRVDAGRAEYTARDGERRRVAFLNVASLGMSGLVTRLVNEAPKTFGGRVSFLAGTLRALAQWRSQPVTLRLDGAVVHDGPLHLATAANGAYFGGGMHVAPNAAIDDGLLDVVIIGDVSKAELLRRLPLLYRGAHVGLPNVRSLRGRRLEADAAPGGVWTEIDGEPLGTLPAAYEILPGAVTLAGV
ncbi:MAG: diacylglycerol kinase family lipid kinase [Deltaproteobacteria bacterium]|nr:diacylglycerol kinase family lipid kinase [Deltaproteobacteria bacterium]